LPGTAAHSLQPVQKPAAEAGGDGAGVADGVGAGVVAAVGAGVVTAVGAGVVTGVGAGVVAGVGVGSGSGVGSGAGPAPPTHWHSPASAQGHQACPLAHGEQSSSLAAWALPGTAAHSLQPVQKPAAEAGGDGAGVADGVGAGVVAAVGAGVVTAVGAGVVTGVGAGVAAGVGADAAILKSAQFRNASGYELGELPVMYSHWRVHGASCVQTSSCGRNTRSVYLPLAPAALGLGSVQRTLCPAPGSPQSPPLLQQLPSGAQISGYCSFWPAEISSPGPSQRTLACVPA